MRWRIRIAASVHEKLTTFPVNHRRAIAEALEALAVSPSRHAVPGSVMGYLPHMQGILVFFPDAEEPTHRYALFFELDSDEIHLDIVHVGVVAYG